MDMKKISESLNKRNGIVIVGFFANAKNWGWKIFGKVKSYNVITFCRDNNIGVSFNTCFVMDSNEGS